MIASTPHLVRLEDVATFLGGSTPSRTRPQYFGGGIPWVKTTDLNNGLISETEETLSPLGLAESSCKMIPANAILVAMYGGFNQIGRTGLLQQESAINQALTAVIPDPRKLAPAFLLEWLNLRVGYWKRFAGSSRKDPNITKGNIADFPVPLMPVDQQIASACILATWNLGIEKTERLIAAKLKRNEILSNQLLFGHARFRQRNTKTTRALHWFSAPSDWQVMEIGKVAREVSTLNGSDSDLPVLSCTKYDGLVDSLKYFDKQVFSQDTSKYKVVRHGQFAYATNHIEEGSIGYQDLVHAGLVSPIYTVFQADAKMIDDGYFYKLLKTEKLRQIFAANTNSSVDRRGSLRWKDFARIHIPLPPVDEQREINAMLDDAKREIALLQAEVKVLKTQKRGLMQKLLTGQWRVTVPTPREVSDA
ncbi:MAG: restriction endonuclease subunit S [Thiobacillus sp.]|nr:restriction endonuclease subunit S [Thiobacillus sp.]